MDHKVILEQSKNAYGQWCEQWRRHAKIHSTYPMYNLSDFENIGIGRVCLVAANGHSLERNMETIKKYRGNVDILCCDKSLGHLINNGITPNYCLVADANVNYEKYLAPYIDKVKDVILFQNVCGNPEWSRQDKFKKIYFYCNVDILGSEKEFSELSGCKNFIPAATNVSGAQVVFLTQSNNEGRRNAFGYDIYCLIGFDYSFTPGKYYAYDAHGGGKDNYMRHSFAIGRDGQPIFTSNNLTFSAKWLEEYINVFKLPVVNCDKSTILNTKWQGPLEKFMRYSYKQTDKHEVKSLLVKRNQLVKELQIYEGRLKQLGDRHWRAFLTSLWG